MNIVICPGYVKSCTDGEMHYISSSQLIKLYGVKSTDRVVIGEKIGFINNDVWLELRPRYDGKYYNIHETGEKHDRNQSQF